MDISDTKIVEPRNNVITSIKTEENNKDGTLTDQ